MIGSAGAGARKRPAPDDDEGARAAAYRLLAVRARSSSEMEDRLSRRGYGRQARNRVMRVLLELGHLDDEKFTRSWVRSRLEDHAPSGRLRIRAELRAKGIPDEMVEACITEAFRDVDEEMLARKLVRRRMRQMDGLDEPVRRRRLRQLLLRRGFSPDIAASVLEESF